MPKKVFFLLIFILFSILTIRYTLYADTARAEMTACESHVSPDSLSAGSSGTLTFSMNNTDGNGNLLKWIKISRPSSDFTITSIDGPYIGGTSVAGDGSYVTVSLSGMSSGEQADFSVGVTAGGNSVSAASFTVQASDTTEGDNPVTCTGDTSVAIGSGGQSGVNISNLAISVTNSSATLTWATSANATGSVAYGTSSSYGSTATDTNSSTSHSVTITGLSASTTYHYQVASTDTNNNSAQTSDNTFTTSAASVTTTKTVTVNTVTTTVATVKKDVTTPSVKIKTDFSLPYKVAPEISGTANDLSRIVKVEYSIDGGLNWISANADNLGEKTTNFSFTPNISEDGNYKVIVRAIDGAENKGTSSVNTLIIDRLPPLIGASIWSIGPITLLPNVNGVVTSLAGVENKITMSAVGGPVSVDLYIGETKYSMMKSSDSGLWSGEINSTSSGFYVVKVKSVDGAGNITERDLNSILFVDKGKILTQGGVRAVDNAKITVYKEDEQSKVWSVWDGASFGQNNPQVTNVDGGYSYFLPNGTYYLTVTASDFKKVTSSIFKIDRPTAINMDFDMNAQSKINFGAWSFALPDFTFKTVDMVIHEPKINSDVQKENPLVEHEIPDFILPKTSGGYLNSLELRGKPQIIIFINSWLPETSSQINEIANLPDGYKQKISLILIEDSLSKAVVFSKRGGYDKLTIVSDSDGSLITPFKLNILPTSYFLDKKGIVKKVVNGTILKDDIINYIDSI